jgi:hypothetical protein
MNFVLAIAEDGAVHQGAGPVHARVPRRGQGQCAGLL